jgi:ribosome biogenesis protein UTP30
LREHVQQESQIKTLKAQVASNPKSRNFAVTLSYVDFPPEQAAVEKNAKEIKDHIEELYWGTGNKVVLLGHSKGGVDAAAACSMFWLELKGKVVGLVLVQSPYGGSPIASDILHEGQIADVETRLIMEVLICKIIKV